MSFIRSFRLPHKKLEELTNLEANIYIVNIMRVCGKLCGADATVPNLKMNIRAALLVIITHAVFISFAFLLFTDEPINQKLEGFVLLLVVWQAVYKFWSVFLNSDYFCEMNMILNDLHLKYIKNSQLALEFKQILYYWCVIVEAVSVLFTVVGATFLSYPILSWYIFHEQVTIIPIPLPLLAWREPFGYTINIVHQIMIMGYGVFGLIILDSLFLYQVIHTISYSKVFEHRVTLLNQMLESDSPDVLAIQTQLHECIKAHQDYIMYIRRMDDHYAPVCMVQLVSCQLALILALFLTLWSHWIIGPFLSAALYFQVIEYCILGTVVTIQNEKISENIYGMTWYRLPVRLQRLVIIMIARAQNSDELHVGGFAKLNVETAMTVTKSIYTYVMMMLEFIS